MNWHILKNLLTVIMFLQSHFSLQMLSCSKVLSINPHSKITGPLNIHSTSHIIKRPIQSQVVKRLGRTIDPQALMADEAIVGYLDPPQSLDHWRLFWTFEHRPKWPTESSTICVQCNVI